MKQDTNMQWRDSTKAKWLFQEKKWYTHRDSDQDNRREDTHNQQQSYNKILQQIIRRYNKQKITNDQQNLKIRKQTCGKSQKIYMT